MNAQPPPPEGGWPEPDAPTVVAPGGPPAPPPADRRIGAGMLLALGAIGLVALGFLITYLLTHRHNSNSAATTTAPLTTTQPPTTTHAAALVPVPDVRGVQAPHAESVLKSVGLKSQRTYVSGKPSGSVVAQSPAAGASVSKGSQVLLSVAKGPATTTTSATTTTAQTTTAQSTTAQTTTQAASPPQPTTATVPDLSGLDEAGAAQALGKVGLLASLAFVPAQDPLGTVEAQAKKPGTTVPSKSHVQVNISTGPGTKAQETVPNVVGKALNDALATLNGAHLRLIYLKYPVTTKAQAGKVVQQTPLSGAQAPENAQVIVYLGAFKK